MCNQWGAQGMRAQHRESIEPVFNGKGREAQGEEGGEKAKAWQETAG